MDETAHFMDETARFMDENVTFQSYGSKGHFMDETAKLMEKNNSSPVRASLQLHGACTLSQKATLAIHMGLPSCLIYQPDQCFCRGQGGREYRPFFLSKVFKQSDCFVCLNDFESNVI
jgi:hypothetical protein